MPKEFETKVLDIDAEDIKKKLKELGAKEYPEVLFKRWIFDETEDPSAPKSSWIRLRTDGKKTTLTYKHREGTAIDGTEEVEVGVEDFEKAAEILLKISFKTKLYQENRRQMFKLKGIEFCIDTWPMVPPHLEIEAPNEKKVKEGLKMLGLESKDNGNFSVYHIYAKQGIDLHAIPELKF
jgi:adenylate cyclase class 2